MPYIPEERRKFLNESMKLVGVLDYFKKLSEERYITEGDLNHILTKIITTYLGKEPNYARFNQVLGVLSAIPFELYRRKIAPYEDKKIEVNGDVYV